MTVDRTLLLPAPSQPDVDDDRQNWFEAFVNFALNELPGWLYVAVVGMSTAAAAIEMFIEIGPWWSALVTAGLIGSAIYGGSRLRRLPLVPVVVKKEGSRA